MRRSHRNEGRHHRGQQTPQLCLCHHVAVTEGCHSHDHPGDVSRHRLELEVGPDSLDHKDAVVEDHLKQKNKEQEDAAGAGTALGRLEVLQPQGHQLVPVATFKQDCRTVSADSLNKTGVTVVNQGGIRR